MGDDGSQALFDAADAQEARLEKLEQFRKQAKYPPELFEIPVILDRYIHCFEEFSAVSMDPGSSMVAFLAIVGLISEIRLQIEPEGPLGREGIKAFNLSDATVIQELNDIRNNHPVALIQPLFNAIKHASSSVEKELKINVALKPTRKLDIRFNSQLVGAWTARAQSRGLNISGYDGRNILDLFTDISKTIRVELEKVARRRGFMSKSLNTRLFSKRSSLMRLKT